MHYLKHLYLKLRPAITPLVISFVIIFGLMLIFAGLAEEIRDGDTIGFDQTILLWLNAHATAGLNNFFVVVTDFGDKFFVAAMTLLLIAVYVHRREWHKAIFVATAIGGAALLNLLLKLSFQRQRPDLWQQIVHEASFSFPSGHAMASSALAACIVVLLFRSRYRWSALIIGVSYVLLIGLSRLYLGVHYPTDVLGGWIASLTWVLLCATILRRFTPKLDPQN